ncbi:uncharacterized protein LTHEOB_4177 [Lasiodiplodia theobromae]|uniref:uncharacterized protein n=1 Tax=Lasiodiplodia theobromae TaxID=45133 RepID=UPI0015C3D4D2|nr:uncharacterized protein LTHEOB_4177 [Lasiodiplodia theobromae]KAF4546180.1 hypothetical protein LTHEOB_4177 [Lasiodiplodia theobromae]
MSKKPIFAATHPRACSTAFERVFMTCQDTLQCLHEPFGDAFYYGPERLSERYENDPKARKETQQQGKRVFIKDMAYYLMPPDRKPASIAPSLLSYDTGATNGSSTIAQHPSATHSAEPAGNPTVVPANLLSRFHWTFLIRHPRHSLPSYHRCTVPPLAAVTGWSHYLPSEVGYGELQRLFDYLRGVGIVSAGQGGSSSEEAVEVCVIDADDLLDDPAGVVRQYCESVGIEFRPGMLRWGGEEGGSRGVAEEKFRKWKGWHEDAIQSTDLKPRAHFSEKKKSPKSDEELNAEWVDKFGEEGARVIKETVENNVADYEYLKQFAMKV